MIPLYKPHMPPLPELDDILYSGQLAYGKYAKAFEENLEKFLGNKFFSYGNFGCNFIVGNTSV